MQDFPEVTEYYIGTFRRGDVDNAFHGLLEVDRDILPYLMQRVRTECDAQVREFLVHVIWEYREESAITFFGEVLRDSEPRVWREALNGLVALGSPAALDVLRSVKVHERADGSSDFGAWVDEAIDQVERKR